MKIYSVNQNPTQANKNPTNFTGTFNVKLYGIIDTPQGQKLIKAHQIENISSGLRTLINIVKGRNHKDQQVNQNIIDLFNQKIFKPHEIAKPSLRSSSYDKEVFLYTGSEAEQLEIIGTKFEKAHKKVDALGQNIPLHEIEKKLEAVKIEYAKLMQIINSPEHFPKLLLKDGLVPEPIEIHIKAFCPLKKTKKGQKYQINIKEVTLERYGTEPENQIPNPTLYPPSKKPAKIVEKRFSNRYTPSAKKVPHNIQGNLFA